MKVFKEHIVGVVDRNIITDDGTSTEVDVIVLATGFKTHNGMLGDIKSNVEENYQWINNDSQMLNICLYSYRQERSVFI